MYKTQNTVEPGVEMTDESISELPVEKTMGPTLTQAEVEASMKTVRHLKINMDLCFMK